MVKHPARKIFEFLSDFRNYEQLIPEGRVKNWTADGNSCHFSVDGIGEAGMKIIDREPYTTIKFSGDGPYSIDFNLWIQIKEVAENDSRIKLTLKAEMNNIMASMAKGPVRQFLDILVDYLEKLDYTS